MRNIQEKIVSAYSLTNHAYTSTLSLTLSSDVEDSEVAGLQREIALDAATESAIKSSIETHEKTKVNRKLMVFRNCATRCQAYRYFYAKAFMALA